MHKPHCFLFSYLCNFTMADDNRSDAKSESSDGSNSDDATKGKKWLPAIRACMCCATEVQDAVYRWLQLQVSNEHGFAFQNPDITRMFEVTATNSWDKYRTSP